ncbi:carbohydrate sulfotransferase 10-like [Mizuhopecten yessoensis]|uniref:Carbohydrate sulfotransferase n=1 Tax=Mizuhopecten yessoensis TaxID=6573 RepID=A0A210QQK8_MIZYE|nr:carbohydrate sulfotransferase 10-like [Mizuhopecten yessoensis]OWF50994.1 Carbohydrate sulfotransferase 11 [Mizuhopecten yessoensis]
MLFRRLVNICYRKLRCVVTVVLILMVAACYVYWDNWLTYYRIRTFLPGVKWSWYPPNTVTSSKVENIHLYHSNDIHEKRKQQLTSACKTVNDPLSYMKGGTGLNVKRNFLLDQNHHVFFCRIEKIGSKFIVKFLQKLEEVTMPETIKKEKSIAVKELIKSKQLSLISELPNISFTDLHRAIMKSFKFLFVREPYGRLVSGYVDKFLMPNSLFWTTLGKLASKILHNTDVKCGHNLSFPDFIRFVVHTEHTGEHTNRHFTSMCEHCRPCDISYDLIGKMETFRDDFSVLLNAWNKIYNTNVTFDDFESETAYERAMFYSKRLFGMKSRIEKCVSFYEGMERTWIGLQTQGIVPKYARFPFTESDAPGMSLKRFQESIGIAIKTVTDKSAVKYQKTEAVIEAYSLVSIDDLNNIRELVRQDCQLFGYDDSPGHIFTNRTKGRKNNVQYFKMFKT